MSKQTNPFSSRFLFHAYHLVVYFLCIQTTVVSAFNKKTLQNAHDYLVKNNKNITWEVNESGFVRARFPIDILHPDETVLSYLYDGNLNDGNLKLRSNFWYGERLKNGSLQDAAAHDHPNGFASYIVANGYTHENYVISSHNHSATECERDLMQERKGQYCANLSIFNKKSAQLTRNGTMQLSVINTQDAQANDIVIFDDQAIHRILNYQKDSLTLNIVRTDGKGNINILLLPGDTGEAKKTREMLAGDDALPITKKAIQLYREAISGLDKTGHLHKRVLRYSRVGDPFLSHSTSEVRQEGKILSMRL